MRVNSFSEVEDSILLHGATGGRYCRVRRAILDAGVVLPEGCEVGLNPEDDLAHGYHVTDSDVTVVAAG